jgi:translation initiation factor 2 beta subunit (eIF-2beta)/eIF-5
METTFERWKKDFVEWYEKRNPELVEAKSSMDMIDELTTLFQEMNRDEKKWFKELMNEWKDSGDVYQKYDGRVLSRRIEEENLQ